MAITRTGNFDQGIYIPKNRNKYIGKYPIVFRSSWELVFMKFCDSNDSVLAWSSEPVEIPYFGVDGRWHKYIPDFLIKYRDKRGVMRVDLIEIKPENQTVMEKAKGTLNKIEYANNMAKWEAAKKWCAAQGIGFKVLTEKDLFGYSTRRGRRKEEANVYRRSTRFRARRYSKAHQRTRRNIQKDKKYRRR